IGQQEMEAQIERARTQAAREARLEERVKRLEAEQRRAQRSSTIIVRPDRRTTPAPASSTPDPPRSRVIAQLGSFSSLAAAQSQASRLSDLGLHPLILHSTDYVQLRPGYWVVYEGFYPTRDLAETAVTRAREAGVSDAFARAATSR